MLEKCCSETAAGRKQDTRITGSSAIDQQLQKVCVSYLWLRGCVCQSICTVSTMSRFSLCMCGGIKCGGSVCGRGVLCAILGPSSRTSPLPLPSLTPQSLLLCPSPLLLFTHIGHVLHSPRLCGVLVPQACHSRLRLHRTDTPQCPVCSEGLGRAVQECRLAEPAHSPAHRRTDSALQDVSASM